MQAYNWYWHDETTKKIIVFELKLGWTWDDALHIVCTQYDLLSTVDHKVDTLFVFENTMNGLPQGNALSNLRKLMSISHANEDQYIFVGKNTVLEMFISAVGTAYKMTNQMSRYHFVPTLDEALALVQTRG